MGLSLLITLMGKFEIRSHLGLRNTHILYHVALELGSTSGLHHDDDDDDQTERTGGGRIPNSRIGSSYTLTDVNSIFINI